MVYKTKLFGSWTKHPNIDNIQNRHLQRYTLISYKIWETHEKILNFYYFTWMGKQANIILNTMGRRKRNQHFSPFFTHFVLLLTCILNAKLCFLSEMEVTTVSQGLGHVIWLMSSWYISLHQIEEQPQKNVTFSNNPIDMTLILISVSFYQEYL